MNEQRLMEALVASAGKVPGDAEVIALEAVSLGAMQERTRQFLKLIGQRESRSLDRGDWLAQPEQTAIRLPDGARAMLYHASGAMRYVAGRAPFDALFEKIPAREELTRIVTAEAAKYDLARWAGGRGELVFERLWQTKAQGMDKAGATSEPVLTRIVGAWRHMVEGIPVLGGASVALKLAGDHGVDMMTVQVRPGESKTVDKARIVSPEAAARQIVLQLAAQLGRGELPDDAIEEVSMHFGYLDLGKRKAQRMLAPAFMARISINHKQERQAVVLAVAATEKVYLPICHCGSDALPAMSRLRVARK